MVSYLPEPSLQARGEQPPTAFALRKYNTVCEGRELSPRMQTSAIASLRVHYMETPTGLQGNYIWHGPTLKWQHLF